MVLEVRKNVRTQNSWFWYKMYGPERPPDKRPKFVRTELKNSKKIKIKIYTSIEAKKQVLRDVYRL